MHVQLSYLFSANLSSLLESCHFVVAIDNSSELVCLILNACSLFYSVMLGLLMNWNICFICSNLASSPLPTLGEVQWAHPSLSQSLLHNLCLLILTTMIYSELPKFLPSAQSRNSPPVLFIRIFLKSGHTCVQLPISSAKSNNLESEAEEKEAMVFRQPSTCIISSSSFPTL